MGYPISNDLDPMIYRVTSVGSTNPDGTTTSSASTAGGTPRVAQGNYQNLPAITASGAELTGRPAYTSGIILYMPVGSSITQFIAPAGSAPVGPANGNQLKLTAVGADLREPVFISGTDAIFVTAASNGTGSGTPAILFKWNQS